jgi:hypothetical protein
MYTCIFIMINIKINPQRTEGVFAQNYLQTTPFESKPDSEKLELVLVLPTVRSCS